MSTCLNTTLWFESVVSYKTFRLSTKQAVRRHILDGLEACYVSSYTDFMTAEHLKGKE